MSAAPVFPLNPRGSLAREVEKTADELPAPRFRLLTDVELDSLAEPIPIVADFAFADSLAVMIGNYGTYKTFLLLEIAFCISIGADWHGRRVRQGPVVYVYAEGAWGARRRLAALKAAYGYMGSAPIYFLPTAVLLTEPGQVAQLIAAIVATGITPVAVMIDTVARNMNGDESKVEDMGRFIRGCDTIRETTKALVFMAHHSGWANERSRGSTALPGAMTTEMFVEKDGEVVTIKCTKQKDAPEFSPITLEAFPIAGSLAFRAVVPTRAELTRNERAALTEVQIAPGLRSTVWMEVTGLAKGSFANARKRLLSLAYVKRAGDFYIATDAGRLALGTEYKPGTTDVQTSRSAEVQPLPRPLGREVVPDRGISGADR